MFDNNYKVSGQTEENSTTNENSSTWLKYRNKDYNNKSLSLNSGL